MRPAFLATFAVLVCGLGCGYIGPVVPPSPLIPAPVINLTVVERGDRLVTSFDTPALTTDALGIKRFSDIDLRMGPDVRPFDFDRWIETARRYEVPLPPEGEADDPRPVTVERTFPVSEWQGKTITVAVRTSVKGEGHYSQWSNRIVLEVVPPLHSPQVAAEATGKGYRLTWAAERPGLHWEISRTSPTDKKPLDIGTAEKPEYIDGTAQWDTPYKYTVVAQQGPNAESLPSRPVAVNSPDKFAPSIPSEVNALAGPDSVEVSWTRSPEPDLKGYLVYRSVDGGPFTVVSGVISLPTFSDRKVEHSRTYRYAISSTDTKNNESDKSDPVTVAF